MPTARRALITGITGQDGSYLTEFLLGKGYEVHGIVRRASTFNTNRIDHVYEDPHWSAQALRLHYGDLTDASCLTKIMQEVRPAEVYNLGAQSHVRVSFDMPIYTAESVGMGALKMLEAVRSYQQDTGEQVRYYQASSSEQYGKVVETPQKETTPFHPRSPYAVAKVMAHWATVNYRESYGLHASCGILFNHECVTAETPVIVRRRGVIDILPIADVVPHRTHPRHGRRYTTACEEEGLEVWDRAGWTPVTCMTATWNGPGRGAQPKEVRRIAARGALYHATSDHVVFLSRDGDPVERPAGTVKEGDAAALIEPPGPTDIVCMTEEEAWLLGLLAAEGHVTPEGKVTVTNQDQDILARAERAWLRLTSEGASRYVAPSGFEGGRPVTQLRLLGSRSWGKHLREQLYTRAAGKRVPLRILNGSKEARLAFLRGFNDGDGLKSTPCTYEFQSFKTSSQALAAGLYWLAHSTLGQRAIICTECREGRLYIQINLNSPESRGQKGQHLRRPLEEIVRAEPLEYRGWLFDLATRSGTFHAGVGRGWIHNSPRRGETFVTRKITRAVGRIKLGLQKKLFLGNLDAKRDWGFAGDYVEAMWLMLQQERPDDYVIATGRTISVREFADMAFRHAGLDAGDFIEFDPRYLRPAEVDLLLGDPAKAAKVLGWKPKTSVEDLARMMVEADLEKAKREKTLRDAGHKLTQARGHDQ